MATESKNRSQKLSAAFTLIELLVVISIIGILASIIFVSYTESREQTRDRVRQTTLEEMRLAIEQYRAQIGRYPEQGCGSVGVQWAGGPAAHTQNWIASCPDFIRGLVPDFISELPVDPGGLRADSGYLYRTNADGSVFHLISYDAVERLNVGSYDDRFAACSRPCAGIPGDICATGAPHHTTYGVYSLGGDCF
jgi:prepilin-type N-terminal cleavage/methylation domain-containing protein